MWLACDLVMYVYLLLGPYGHASNILEKTGSLCVPPLEYDSAFSAPVAPTLRAPNVGNGYFPGHSASQCLNPNF